MMKDTELQKNQYFVLVTELKITHLFFFFYEH